MIFARKKNISRTSLAVLVLLCLVVVDFSVFFIMPLSILYPITNNSNPAPQQAAAILFNDFNSDFTDLNNESKRRVHHGLSLLRNNTVEQLIVVGGNREKSKRKGSQLMADYLMEQGVPGNKILIEANSKDSISNMEQLEKILTNNNITSLALVSSPYHLLRLQTMRTPFKTKPTFFPYSPTDCFPPLTRKEIWHSAHYNLLAYAIQITLPESFYKKFVLWVRENTEW